MPCVRHCGTLHVAHCTCPAVAGLIRLSSSATERHVWHPDVPRVHRPGPELPTRCRHVRLFFLPLPECSLNCLAVHTHRVAGTGSGAPAAPAADVGTKPDSCTCSYPETKHPVWHDSFKLPALNGRSMTQELLRVRGIASQPLHCDNITTISLLLMWLDVSVWMSHTLCSGCTYVPPFTLQPFNLCCLWKAELQRCEQVTDTRRTAADPEEEWLWWKA